jgi:hypothetical protein
VGPGLASVGAVVEYGPAVATATPTAKATTAAKKTITSFTIPLSLIL